MSKEDRTVKFDLIKELSMRNSSNQGESASALTQGVLTLGSVLFGLSFIALNLMILPGLKFCGEPGGSSPDLCLAQ